MPITACAYDTYMGQQLEPDTAENVKHFIKKNYSTIFKNLDNKTNSKFNPFLSSETDLVYGITNKDWFMKDLSFFGHPVVIFNGEENKTNALGGFDDFSIVADLRGVVLEDRYGEVKIVDQNSYKTNCVRAVLNYWWLANGTIGPLRSMPVAVNIFSEVIGETIGASVKMELDDSLRLRIWAAIWYYMNHLASSLDTITEHERLGMIKFLAINLRFEVDIIEQVLDAAIAAYDKKLDEIKNSNSRNKKIKDSLLHWFALIPEACESMRLESALKDLGVFISIVSRAHIGQMSGELMAMAFEHPPTWLSLVWGAANNYSNKNSQITKITQRPSYRAGVEQLEATVNRKLA